MANVSRVCQQCGHGWMEKSATCKCPHHRIWRQSKV